MDKGKKDKKEKVPFKDRKIVKWATENAPGIIGNSLDFIGDVTGVEVLENLGEKIAGSDELTPEQKAEAAEILKADIERLKLENEDRADARNREVLIATSEKSPTLNKIITPVLALSIIGLVFLLFYLIMFRDLGVEKDILVFVLGALVAFASQVIQYYFGSSVGSKENGAAMRKMLER